MIFVDTGAWFACFVSSDANHQRASEWYLANTNRLATTDYVLTELLTLLKARGEFHTALDLGDHLWSGELARIEYVTHADILSAWSVYKTFTDKTWSFTDCVSRVVMERLGIAQAFAFDEHFRQFGTVHTVP